jgi:hypothetical protein
MEGRTRVLTRGGKVEAGGLSRIAKEVSQTREYCVARNAPLRLRSEFVTLSKWPKIDAANKTVTTTKSSKIQKSHKLSGQTLLQPRAECFECNALISSDEKLVRDTVARSMRNRFPLSAAHRFTEIFNREMNVPNGFRVRQAVQVEVSPSYGGEVECPKETHEGIDK